MRFSAGTPVTLGCRKCDISEYYETDVS